MNLPSLHFAFTFHIHCAAWLTYRVKKRLKKGTGWIFGTRESKSSLSPFVPPFVPLMFLPALTEVASSGGGKAHILSWSYLDGHFGSEGDEPQSCSRKVLLAQLGMSIPATSSTVIL